MKKLKLIFIICLLIFSFTGTIYATNFDYIPKLTEESPVIYKQPNGPFAAIFFCEYAQGNYLGVFYYERIVDPKYSNLVDNSVWSNSNRFWQDDEWNSDINNFAWSPSGKYLYVATSNVYGTGGLFELNLFERTVRKVFPTPDDENKLRDNEYLAIYIKNIDIKKMILNINIETEKDKFEKAIKMQ